MNCALRELTCLLVGSPPCVSVSTSSSLTLSGASICTMSFCSCITPHRRCSWFGDIFLCFVWQVFDDMCHQLHITPNNAQATFVTIVNELFSDGIKWGRIVALFAFSGALAVQCVQKEMPLLVDQVVDWTVAYIDGHLMSWIVQNGDWVSYVLLLMVSECIFTPPRWQGCEVLWWACLYVCLSARISQRPRVQTSQNFLYL